MGVVEVADISKPEDFDKMDSDGDGKLSEEEFVEIWPDGSHLEKLALFSQADIDDDGGLSLPEATFAAYIAREQEMEKVFASSAPLLPANFRQRIDNAFVKLRSEWSTTGKVTFDAVTGAMRELLGVQDGHDDGAAVGLRDIFDFADITEDGTLNFNELDLFHYMMREALIGAAVEMAQPRPQGEDQMSLVGRRFMHNWDADGNGRLSEVEVLTGFPKWAGDSPEDSASYLPYLREWFQRADADGDGSLDLREAAIFAEYMTSVQ